MNEGFKAVCYRCSYESPDAGVQAGRSGGSRCPVCRFPFILEPESTPPAGRRIEDLLHRPSVASDAPLLPGVDPDKRPAQLQAEQRKRRETERLVEERARRRALTAEVVAEVIADRSSGTSVHRGRGLAAKVGFTVMALSAVAAGALAAALQHGG